jgi:hypothetical protein
MVLVIVAMGPVVTSRITIFNEIARSRMTGWTHHWALHYPQPAIEGDRS